MAMMVRNPRRRLVRLLVPLLQMFQDLQVDDEEDERKWEKITVNMEEYRTMGDPSFRSHFRVTKPMFEELLVVVQNHLIDVGRYRRTRRDFAHILLMVLWILATPDSFRSVALRFEVHPGTVHSYYGTVIEALRELGDRFVQWPNAQ